MTKNINFKKTKLLIKRYEDKISELFIYDEYFTSRKNINLVRTTGYDNCLFFVCKDNNGVYYQVNNIKKSKSVINDIQSYINFSYIGCKKNIFDVDESVLSKYVNKETNNIVISLIKDNNITEFYKDTITKYDLNLDKNDTNLTNLTKMAKENSIVLWNVEDIDKIVINNTYYLSNCVDFRFGNINSFVRECIFFGNSDNVWVLINNYLRSESELNISNHKLFSKTMFYECLEQNLFAKPNNVYIKFLTRFLRPSKIKLQLINSNVNMDNIVLNEGMFYSDKEYHKCTNNLKKELLMYNFCTCSQMFENSYVFNDVYYNFVYDNNFEYEWNIVIPYHNRIENLEYLIKNLKNNVLTNVNAMITVVEISDEITLDNYKFFNEINYIWINKKKLGGHFVKCLCANFSHKLLSDQSYMYKYILWHDVDCATSKNFVNEINKKYDYSAIHTFHQKCILYANYELSCKIRNDEISIDDINPTIYGVTTSDLGVYGGSILISVKLFEEIGMFNTSVFYDHSPEDNFILQLVKKYGKYCEVKFNNNYMIHLWHDII